MNVICIKHQLKCKFSHLFSKTSSYKSPLKEIIGLKHMQEINNWTVEMVKQWPFTPDSSSNVGENFLHGDGRQVRVEATFIVATSEHEEAPADRAGGAAVLLWGQFTRNRRLHGDDGVPCPGDRKLRDFHLCPGVGVWKRGLIETQTIKWWIAITFNIENIKTNGDLF